MCRWTPPCSYQRCLQTDTDQAESEKDIAKKKNIAAKKSIRRHKNKRSTLPQTLAGKSKKNPQSEQKKGS